jgi:hypothetical protein
MPAPKVALQTAASTDSSPRDVERDGPLLELIKMAGGDLDCALASVRLLQETRPRIATRAAAITGDDADVADEVLTEYCQAERLLPGRGCAKERRQADRLLGVAGVQRGRRVGSCPSSRS